MSEVRAPAYGDQFVELAREVAKGLKTREDLAALLRTLNSVAAQAAPNTDRSEYPGCGRHAAEREGTFEPQLAKKDQHRGTALDAKILALYARGMTTRDIVGAFKELHDAVVSPPLVSNVTESGMEEVTTWECRPLDTACPIVCLDGLVVNIRQGKQVLNKSIHVALSVNLGARKEPLGFWMAQSEGAQIWLKVLTEIKNRGLDNIFIACVDVRTPVARSRSSGDMPFTDAGQDRTRQTEGYAAA